MKYIDMHCDSVVECYLNNEHLRNNKGHIDFTRLHNNNSMAQFFAIFIPREETLDKNVKEIDFFNKVYDYYMTELENNKDLVLPAYSYDDINQNMNSNKVSSILTIEDSGLLDNNLNRIEELYEKGVRLMTLTWNYENCLGYPNSFNQDIHNRGLKDFGIEAVKKMNQLGIIVDVSHLSEGGLRDVVKYSSKPIVASHSCARALCDHSRNLSDEGLKLIAETEGCIGINFYSQFLKKDSNYAAISDIVEHVKYMASKIGTNYISLGSDFDGIDSTLELKDYSGMNLLAKELKRHFTDGDVEKICYLNSLRVLKDCLL